MLQLERHLLFLIKCDIFMAMESTKKKKISLIVSACVYFVLIISICASIGLVFHSYYYMPIFVSGSSMYPTLVGDKNNANFGIVDNHKKAIDRIERFDIVTTYYPWEDYDDNNQLKSNASFKIKRVIALPGETFKIESGVLYVGYLNEETESYDFTSITYTFDTNPSWKTGQLGSRKDVNQRTLGDNEYWVMGDNRQSSTDCARTQTSPSQQPIIKDNIVGVLVAIEGVGKITVKNGKESITNKTYQWPRFY